MKRVIVWMDTKDEEAERVCRKLQRFLKSIGITHRIVDTSELACSYSDDQ